ncbi:YdcF family protein [uncultured Sphingomonas sp.]|uniref:YdcF family protein n=1 Tax=uncultured Sphingomonas sp. TaxID=158754 RepID=UPI0025CE94AC|nr:YdcF family protein [uncultured Sphingomonas sp.]
MIRRLFSLVVLLWALGFVAFAIYLPQPAGDDRTDGIVVLTGGPGRLKRGLDLLEQGGAERMLISGVDRRVRAGELAQVHSIPPKLLARIDLGRSAVDTRSNALETRRWIVRHRYRSVRLITTDWHMARARFELRQVLSGVRVVKDAVPSEPDLWTLLREYHKLLLRRGAALVGH